MVAKSDSTPISPIRSRRSQIDGTYKLIFPFKGHNVEYVYVDNRTGKDIVCVPSQTGCNLGCEFCHLTLRKDPQIRSLELEFSLCALMRTLREGKRRDTKNKTLLISFMGAGEPLLSIRHASDVMRSVQDIYATRYSTIRFGMASIVPTVSQLEALTEEVLRHKLPLKLHWSLHHPIQEERAKYMPNAAPIEEALPALLAYRERTGNPIEAHYTVFEGNDTNAHAEALAALAVNNDLPIKFLQFSERPDKAVNRSARQIRFPEIVRFKGAKVEEYTPPGHDILGACGEFEQE